MMLQFAGKLADGILMSGSPTVPFVPISVVLDATYVLDLPGLPMAELRRRRTQCARIESSVSYERQLIQGRLDIVRDEQSRRRLDEAVEAPGLVDRLPSILTVHAHASGVGRPPTFMFPVQLDVDRQDRMHRIAPASTMAALAGQSVDEISVMEDLLEAMEHEISAERRALHGVFDQIQSEVIRRYKSGEVPMESAFYVAPERLVDAEPQPDGLADLVPAIFDGLDQPMGPSLFSGDGERSPFG
jgi:hypothetical protein